MTALTAPGVYVQELPGGNRTIQGVSTSLTAFVGRARRGPTDAPTRIFSWGDYERQFGGLWIHSPMSQAVRQYFQHGGAQALIVRVVNNNAAVPADQADVASAELSVALVLRATAAARGLTDFDHLRLTVTGTGATGFDVTAQAEDASDTVLSDAGGDFSLSVALDAAADISAALAAATTGNTADIALLQLVGSAIGTVPADGVDLLTDEAGIVRLPSASGPLKLEARSAGAWGNRLQAEVSLTDSEGGAAHLTVRELDADGNTVAEEVHYGVTLGATDARALDRVLELESTLARVDGTLPGGGLVATTSAEDFAGGDDGAAPRITEDLEGSAASKTGLHALNLADELNLLCIPLASWSTSTAAEVALWTTATVLCERLRAFLIIDPPSEFGSYAGALSSAPTFSPRSHNAALYMPRVRMANPLKERRLDTFPPCGVIAGVMAKTDAQRGIWKAPAGTDAVLSGVSAMELALTDAQQGTLNPLGINCLRTFPVYGPVVWGARTLRGADAQASEWKYVPVRRLALHIEESLFRGTRWAVFEPNDAPLWGQLRLSIRGFMHQLFRQGAFQGSSPKQAYFVQCDADTTTQADIDRGVVNVLIGFAPLKPAEFVIIKLQQMAAQAQ